MDITVLGFVANFLDDNEYFLIHVNNGEIEDTFNNKKDFMAKPPISGYYKVASISTGFSLFYGTVLCINAYIPPKFFSM